MFPYYGAKRRLAPTYDPPLFDTIIEPFAGSASYAVWWLENDPDLSAIVVEKDEVVADLWDRLLGMTGDDIRELPDIKAGEKCRDALVSVTASAFSAVSALGRSGEFQITSRMVRDWHAVKERTAQRRDAVGNRISVIHGDYTDAPDIEACWFIDPPYQFQGVNSYRIGSDLLDFSELADWCRSRRGQVQVCEAEPADWLPFEKHTLSNDIHSRPKQELLWRGCGSPSSSRPDRRGLTLSVGGQYLLT